MDRLTYEALIESAAGDGGTAPTGQRSAFRVDLEELVRAWSIERSHSIECEILLKLSRVAIAQLLAADRRQSTPDHLSNLCTLLRRIDSQLDEGPEARG